MKKTLIILSSFSLAILNGAETPPIQNPDTESPPDLTSPVYAIPDAPFRDRTEKPELSTQKKALFTVLGTIATITIGLLVSGADTGKHVKPSAEKKKSA